MNIKLWRENGEVKTNVEHKYKWPISKGFDFGCSSIGAAELSLNILVMNTDYTTAKRLCQEFRCEFIAKMPTEGGTIKEIDIKDFIANRMYKDGGF